MAIMAPNAPAASSIPGRPPMAPEAAASAPREIPSRRSLFCLMRAFHGSTGWPVEPVSRSAGMPNLDWSTAGCFPDFTTRMTLAPDLRRASISAGRTLDAAMPNRMMPVVPPDWTTYRSMFPE